MPLIIKLGKVNLYMDVYRKYINELNNEIEKVRDYMPKTLKSINLNAIN